jgi:hypothetical protein
MIGIGMVVELAFKQKFMVMDSVRAFERNRE